MPRHALIFYVVSAMALPCGLFLLEAWRPAGLEADHGIRLGDGSRLTLSKGRSRQLC